MDISINDKISRLRTELQQYPSIAVAFSGGVDSTLLLTMAHDTLVAGDKPVAAVTAVSPIHPQKDLQDAAAYTRQRKIRHILVHTAEMAMPAFTDNPPDRCYICKKIVFARIRDAALALGITHLIHGVNADDHLDYRPGIKAAEEMGIAAPLSAAGLTKSDVRAISRHLGLSTWNKPSSGCLATRIPYHHPITEKKLEMIGRAENILADFGVTGSRVRHYDELAKIELPEDAFELFLPSDVRNAVTEKFRQIGFLFVSIDIEPYRTGRMNRCLASERYRPEP
jgi:pyridinium-3,5-biscarboxylic acid mononucleotide sulfurtransferase